MLFQILRTIVIGALIYLGGKILRQIIDRQLEKTSKPPTEKSESTARPQHLTPCPVCGIYYNSDNPASCSRKDCPL